MEVMMNERYEIFTTLIHRINRNIRKIRDTGMSEYNFRNIHVSCLYQLYLSNGLTSTELCERCEEDKATISRAIEYLEKNGYLVCQSKTAKRYKSPIMLTDSGVAVGKQIADKIDVVLQDVSSCLSDEERKEFYRCLTMISDRLDTISKKFAGVDV
jgi:DNA-binding MarR family transcriptional regulator